VALKVYLHYRIINLNLNHVSSRWNRITPFRSIKYDLDNGLDIHLLFIQIQTILLDAIFKTQNQNLKIDYFDSSKEGHLDSDKLKALLPTTDFKQTTFGSWSKSFVDAMEEIFEIGDSEDNIKTEKFTGY
jgi:hypothetical protein